MTTIHPSPNGSRFTVSGVSASAPLRSTTVPLTGAYTSDTDFVDSTSPKGSPAWTSVPTSGTSTYTTSPRASWAKSVMPTRTRPPPSSRAHSCSLVYLRSSGNSTPLPSPERVLRGSDLAEGQCSHIAGRRQVPDEAPTIEPCLGPRDHL